MNEGSHLDALTEKQIRRSLLGVLAPDPCWDAENVEIIETELIDQYVRGELAGEELRQFESNYLRQPGSRRKVDVAVALQRCFKPQGNPWWRIGGSVGLAATIALAVIVYWHVATATLYPGDVRGASAGYPEIGRFLPRPIRLAVVDPVPAGHAQAVLRNPAGEIWKTDIDVAANAEYLTIVLPTWRIPQGSYSIELLLLIKGQPRTVASYRIRLD